MYIIKKEHISVFLITHITSAYFGVIPPPPNHPLYLQPNWKDMVAALSVVEITEEVAEAVVVRLNSN